MELTGTAFVVTMALLALAAFALAVWGLPNWSVAGRGSSRASSHSPW